MATIRPWTLTAALYRTAHASFSGKPTLVATKPGSSSQPLNPFSPSKHNSPYSHSRDSRALYHPSTFPTLIPSYKAGDNLPNKVNRANKDGEGRDNRVKVSKDGDSKAKVSKDGDNRVKDNKDGDSKAKANKDGEDKVKVSKDGAIIVVGGMEVTRALTSDYHRKNQLNNH